MRVAARALLGALVAAAALVAPGASAAPSAQSLSRNAQALALPGEPSRPSAASALPSFDLAPAFPGAPRGAGWFSTVARVTNRDTVPLQGTLVLESTVSWSSAENQSLTRAEVNVEPGGTVVLELPTRSFAAGHADVSLKLLTPTGEEVPGVRAELPPPPPDAVLVVDLSDGGRLATQLRSRFTSGPSGGTRLAASTPRLRADGNLQLPRLSSGWAVADVVVGNARRLALMDAPAQQALADWVLAGGALALAIDRPEDLRHPFVVALAGGAVTEVSPRADLTRSRRFLITEDEDDHSPTPRDAAPGEALKSALRSHQGGNLRPSPWCDSAPYGLGELHLLSHDPTTESTAADDWSTLQMTALAEHAHTRRTLPALPHGKPPLQDHELEPVRRHLDPNETSRWAIGVAVLLLLGYAIVAGPVNFHRAARRGDPLRALRHLAIWSAVTTGLIVGIGLAAKGFRGQSQRLSLIEAGAGMGRGSITRFRGFYAANAAELTVRGSDPSASLDLVRDDQGSAHHLVLDGTGLRLEALRARPWQTVVVREDAFTSLGGGVSLQREGGATVITNRLARDLVGVVVQVPGEEAVVFARIRDGERVELSAGERLPVVLGGSAPTLDVQLFEELVNRAQPGLAAAWYAMPHQASADWWPTDVPALLALVDGGEGVQADASLRVTRDEVLIRVVGWGGVP